MSSDVISVLSRLRVQILENLPEIYSRRYQITYKPDGSPVTAADVWLEEFICARLKASFPEIAFVGEETFSGESLPEGSMLALIDPIDGTENFCSGLKEWGVSIGIWCDGKHAGSLLMLPELNDHMISGELVEYRWSRITGFSSSYNEKISEGIAAAGEYRVSGCAVYNLINVSRGSFARFINPKGAYVWDLLPGLLLALENNCEILLNDELYDGQLLDPTRKYRIAIRHRYDLHSR